MKVGDKVVVLTDKNTRKTSERPWPFSKGMTLTIQRIIEDKHVIFIGYSWSYIFDDRFKLIGSIKNIPNLKK